MEFGQQQRNYGGNTVGALAHAVIMLPTTVSLDHYGMRAASCDAIPVKFSEAAYEEAATTCSNDEFRMFNFKVMPCSKR